MFYWSFTSLVHFWPPPIFNPVYAYDDPLKCHISSFKTVVATLQVSHHEG